MWPLSFLLYTWPLQCSVCTVFAITLLLTVQISEISFQKSNICLGTPVHHIDYLSWKAPKWFTQWVLVTFSAVTVVNCRAQMWAQSIYIQDCREISAASLWNNMTMSGVITLWELLTKCQTTTIMIAVMSCHD
jgi:hypothetical protein